ncbi:MAG: sodium:alanine symporter family protein [Acidobacteria bacterium]|nr:sodium:alanine symporter family protein [Acidobacteriota bacterium]MCG2816328.1 sodium:alanine symporter family protein [Candidatus Aminicenantes bacterium]MBU1338765.1 sodium:alanine symporter family protein [Acidobacteriota bacterium]MBU1474585.1 sodium:alanine symporter family protein [Acidobacteriota bacterium]MBU2439010.1 sodium:alanine symporter family protein [Acidobacteriota bacterium]
MEQLYESITLWIDATASNIWSLMIYVLFAAGIWLTYKTRFIQFRRLGDSMKLIFAGFMGKKSKTKAEGDVSPFAALSTALAATVGNGNIGGVALALVTGGPGAIFWMWICGLVGMATKYAEALLGVKYREKYPDGTIAGGPMYYIKNGIKFKRVAKILAPTFAVCGAFATLFGTGNMMQANQMALAFNSELGIPNWLTGIVITTFVAVVIIGGIKRIGSVAEKLVPTMVLLYLGLGLVVIIANIEALPASIALIFKHAFTPAAAIGGFLGAQVRTAMQHGFRRGLLTNEAGLGSAPIAHAAAQTPSPVHQGLIGIGEVFIDTIVVCSFTAFINLSSGMWTSGLDGTAMTAAAFSNTLPVIGGMVVAFSSFLFGYSTLLGWYYYGEQCMKYLFGVKVTYPYRVIYVGLIFVGSVISIKLVFYIGDIANAFMALPNLIALVLLSGTVGSTTVKFFKKYRKISDFKE